LIFFFLRRHPAVAPGHWVKVSRNAGQWLTLVGVTGVLAIPQAATADEFRGMWVSRFEWPNTNLNTVKSNIDSIMADLAQHRFNAVVFQVRGQADTLYPSPEEPWSPLVSPDGNTPAGWGSFDPLAYALAAAHSRGLEFHAYINTHTCYQSGTPTDPDHLFYAHCNASDPAHRDWLIHDSSGTPVQYASDNYVWIAPGVPAAQSYTRRQVMYVVNNYDVDGIHFDRIRTPGTGYSYDPISQSRRYGEGNPESLSFANWTRDQFTRFCRDMYAQIMEVKPQVKVSSAPLGLYSQDRYPGYPSYFNYGYTFNYQDAQAWIAAGAMDFLVPQIYWSDGGSLPDFSDLLPDWVDHNAGRHIYAGHNISTGITAIIQDINTCRSGGAEGNVIWSYSSFNSGNYWTSLSGPGKQYAQPAAAPSMPWKTNPTTGIIIGTVTNGLTGQPVTDAHISRSGLNDYVALSSEDGLYSFLLVPPGSYSVSFDKAGVGNAMVHNVEVTVGAVTRLNVTLAQTVTCSIFADKSTVRAGESITFTPLVNVPLGDSVLSYTWHFGDGDTSGTGLPGLVTHAYADSGPYTVLLELATSGSGNVSSNLLPITVSPPPGDIDGDGDVDMDDFGVVQNCLTASTIPQEDPACQDARLDGDGDVDGADVDLFLGCLSGANVPSNPFCIAEP